MEFKFATRFDHPDSPSRVISTPSRTRQEFARECDINYILARVGAGLQQLVPPEARYVDVTEVPTNYEDCVSLLADADSRFRALPSKIRDRFHNSPVELFSFLQNEANREEAVSLGLLERVASSPGGDEKTSPSTEGVS